MSIVASVKVNDSVLEATSRAMNLAKWKRYVKEDNIVLKVNAVWDRVYPSCTTTPMVIEGVVRELKDNGFKKITIADTDTPAYMSTRKSFKTLGLQNLAKRYNLKLVSLTYDKFRTVDFNGLAIKKVKVSETLLNAKTIITMPVLKTHGIAKMTGAIKNQWGCIHDLRHNFHPVLDKALADVNNFFKDKITFAVMDAIWGMEGEGPKSGIPVEVGYVFASHDLVALDCLAARVIGYDPREISYIVYSNKVGIGEMKYTIVGNKPPKYNFKKPKHNLSIIGESMLRKTPLEWLLFKTPLFTVLRIITRIYYETWYYISGRNYAKKMRATKFGRMWEAYLPKK